MSRRAAKAPKPMPGVLRSVFLPDGMEAFVRPNTADARTISLAWRSYRDLGVRPGDVVLDIGAHIGIFSRAALHSRTVRVETYEPAPENFALLGRNLNGYPAHLHEAAVVPDSFEGETAVFYTMPGYGTDSHSLYLSRGRKEVRVPATRFSEALAAAPTVVKIDAEGVEYDLLLGTCLPGCVRAVAVEFHLTRKVWRETTLPAVLQQMETHGFRLSRPLHISPAAWYVTLTWRRAE